MTVEVGIHAFIDQLDPKHGPVDNLIDRLWHVTDKSGRPFGDFMHTFGGESAEPTDRAIAIDCEDFVCSGDDADLIDEYLGELAGCHRNGAFVVKKRLDPHGEMEPRVYGGGNDPKAVERAWKQWRHQQLDDALNQAADSITDAKEAPLRLMLLGVFEPATIPMDVMISSERTPPIRVEATVDRTAIESMWKASGLIDAGAATDVGIAAEARGALDDEPIDGAVWRVRAEGVELETLPVGVAETFVSAHMEWDEFRDLVQRHGVEAGHDGSPSPGER